MNTTKLKATRKGAITLFYNAISDIAQYVL
jgi:hypothetical protein